MTKEYTYATNLREQLSDIESSDPACLRKLLAILDNALGVLDDHERRLRANEITAEQAANVASCLANGMQPD